MFIFQQISVGYILFNNGFGVWRMGRDYFSQTYFAPVWDFIHGAYHRRAFAMHEKTCLG